MMNLILIVTGIIIFIIGMGVVYAKQRGKFKMASFLQAFGVDVSEGIESLIYGIRIILLLSLEFVFAHLEAQTLESVMPYREGAYMMGLAMALVAMIAGMTFATEWNLQADRKKFILPAIKDLNIEEKAKNSMLHTFRRTYKANNNMMYTSLIVAVGMHAAIVLMGLFSLWQHENYAVHVMQGGEPLANMPPLDYTVWFNMPLVVSSTLIGLMGFIIDLILGMTSNIKEELYKYKPNKEVIETTKELEMEFGIDDGWDDNDSEVGDDDEEEEEEDGTLEAITEEIVDLQNRIDTIDHEIALNYTGTEDTKTLMEDFVSACEDNGYYELTGITSRLDMGAVLSAYDNGTDTTKREYKEITKKLYTKGLQQQTTLDQARVKINSKFSTLQAQAAQNNVAAVEALHTEVTSLVEEYINTVKKAKSNAKAFLTAIEQLPNV